LLDDWIVAIRFGRTGQGGQEQRFTSPNAEVIKSIVRDRLRRRLSARKRLAYALQRAVLDAVPGFESFAWLSADLLALFPDAAR